MPGILNPFAVAAGGGGGGSASRFYLPSSGTAPLLTAAFDAWTVTSSAVRRPLVAAPSGTANFDYNISSGGTNRSMLYAQYVSPALAAQTILGQTQTGQILADKINTATNTQRMSVGLFDASGTLLQRIGSLIAGSGVVNGVFTNAVLTPVTWPGSVTIAAGAYLVIEIGYFNPNTASSASRVNYRVGDGNGSDLPQDTSTTTTLNPWVQFGTAFALL